MAGKQHQFILGLLVKQMRMEGFKVFFIEGNFIGQLPGHTKIPPNVFRHRPDAIGVSHTGQVCIADAKTTSDIHSKRTREQIKDYTEVELNGMPCEVFIGVPADAGDEVMSLLRRLSLDNYPHIHTLRVPNEIING